MKDDLGDRMKGYEIRTKSFLPRRTYTIIRLDGKAFHTFTKGFERPYDMNLINAMDYTTKMLCENIQGARLAYTQSDEISILLTDFEKVNTSAYLDGAIQKVVSITASMASAYFNQYMRDNEITDKLAFFDSRAFNISEAVEVENYFIWRQQDCVRNSISMTAQALYSHKELHGVNTSGMQDLCMEKGVNWNDQPAGFKRGRMIWKEKIEQYIEPNQNSDLGGMTVTRNKWTINPAIWITKDRERFGRLIPRQKDAIIDILLACVNRFGGPDLSEYVEDVEIINWYKQNYGI